MKRGLPETDQAVLWYVRYFTALWEDRPEESCLEQRPVLGCCFFFLVPETIGK